MASNAPIRHCSWPTRAEDAVFEDAGAQRAGLGAGLVERGLVLEVAGHGGFADQLGVREHEVIAETLLVVDRFQRGLFLHKLAGARQALSHPR
ncbi:MAG: hypothetical protein HC793_00200 [Aquincola sp.]|nr:hypothetical protein [Aquincola sp.]